jgi:hypothetical protein
MTATALYICGYLHIEHKYTAPKLCMSDYEAEVEWYWQGKQNDSEEKICLGAILSTTNLT